MLRCCVWSRNIKNGCSIYIYDISHLRVNFPFAEYCICCGTTSVHSSCTLLRISVGNRKKTTISTVQSGLLLELNDSRTTAVILLRFHCLRKDIGYSRSVLLRLSEPSHNYIPAIEFCWKQITVWHEPRKSPVFLLVYGLLYLADWWRLGVRRIADEWKQLVCFLRSVPGVRGYFKIKTSVCTLKKKF